MLLMFFFLASLTTVGCGSATIASKEGSFERSIPGTTSVHVEPMRHHLGNFPSVNKTKEVQTLVKNNGTSELQIKRLLSSCGYTKPNVNRTWVPPGEFAVITATIALGAIEGPRTTSLTIETSDSIQPVTTVTFAWEIVAPLRGDLSESDLMITRTYQDIEKEVKLISHNLGICKSCTMYCEGNEVIFLTLPKITGHQESGDHSVESPDKNIEIASLKAVVKGSKPPGFYKELVQVLLMCGDEERARATIPFSWKVETALSVTPERLFVGQTEGMRTIEKSILLSAGVERRFRVFKVESDLIDFRYELPLSTNSESRQVIRVSFAAPSTQGIYRGQLKFFTDHPEALEVMVPVSGIVIGSGR
ncbi:Protein of unknown function [Singulisphaera sp. GP187]|uniref:DUF1573 domain-containing protein n=1 Tax=Singulisphaera sp. GP187 TaxID=1882752 RepID=UPI0009280225|nr:DUF1573 domain-containing protein [Singulisphaera sp. GP187]SIO66937.1 Protein of unknown function [Singulisphaera sp. GP187]